MSSTALADRRCQRGESGWSLVSTSGSCRHSRTASRGIRDSAASELVADHVGFATFGQIIPGLATAAITSNLS